MFFAACAYREFNRIMPDAGTSFKDPSYGSGASIGGIGLVLILGLGLILVGLVFMAIMRVRLPAFFRGETLKHESVHAMRPHEHLVS
jgi:hypothetical protein